MGRHGGDVWTHRMVGGQQVDRGQFSACGVGAGSERWPCAGSVFTRNQISWAGIHQHAGSTSPAFSPDRQTFKDLVGYLGNLTGEVYACAFRF